MRALLRSLLSFLDRRFPEKVEVSLAAYKSLDKAIVDLTMLVEIHESKIKMLETNLANVNMAIGFAAPKMGVLER